MVAQQLEPRPAQKLLLMEGLPQTDINRAPTAYIHCTSVLAREHKHTA